MSRCFVICGLLAAVTATQVMAQEHRLEVIEEAPEVKELSKEMAAMFAGEGFRVLRGTSRTVCEIWPCKQWEIAADFSPTSERLYPFKPGQLIGLLHFKRRGKEFRDQTIKSGWYTLRYGLQPTDGNHEGTSPTRDFLLMLRAEADKSPKPVAEKELLASSAEAAGSTHPAMLCLQRTEQDASEKPSVRHVEDMDWWILQFSGKATVAGDAKQAKDLPVALIVVGHADE